MHILRTLRKKSALDGKLPKQPKTVRHPSPPVSIYSLPPEILDEIFSYLLNPKHVQYDPHDAEETHRPSKPYVKHGGTAHSYHFHTNILQVDRTIGNAAAQYMHSQATFVLVTYKCAGLTAMVHRMDVPVVGQHKVKHARHSFAIKISWPVAPFSTITDRRTAKLKASKRGSLLVLAQDLARLQNVLHFHCSFLAPKRVILVRGNDPMVTKACLSKYTPSVTLKAQEPSKQPQTLDLGEMKRFLSGFQHITGIGYKMKTEGFTDVELDEMVSNLKTTLSPSPIWPRAVWWDRFEVARQFKEQADTFALLGKHEAARARYEYLVCWTECDSLKVLQKLDTSRDSSLLAAQERWLLLLFDCCVSQSWLHLRLQNVGSQYPRCGHRLTTVLAKLEKTWGGARSPALDSVWSHVVLLAVVCILSKSRKCAARVPQIAAELILLRKTWGHEIEAHEAHDHALVEDAILRFSTGKKFDLDFDELSARVLPVRIFDHQPEAKLPGRPAGLVHWQDTAHLAALTEEEQSKIATAQRKISKFDLTL